MTAGSEMTATVLSNATWSLRQSPEAILKLVSEVHFSFHDTSEINFNQYQQAKAPAGVLAGVLERNYALFFLHRPRPRPTATRSVN